MRLFSLILLVAACGGGGTDPRVIPGGGIGDGDIDGKVYIHVIDAADDTPLANATVAIAGHEQATTDAKGFVEIKDVKGRQTIAVKLQGYRNTVWAYANGTNVTIPLEKTGATIEKATLSGTNTGWDPSGLPAGHIKGAAVFYSQSDRLGDEENNLQTPAMGNICGGQTCNWTVVSRAGMVTLMAAIVDFDTKNTASTADDTITIIGWAMKSGVLVENNVNQSGITLSLVEAGNMENITIDYGSPPAALTQKTALVGIEVSEDEVIQMPLLTPDQTTILAPKPSVFAANAKLRLTGIAQTPMGEAAAQSIVLRRGLSGTSLSAGEWLTPPVGVSANRDMATWGLVAGAKIHSVQYRDALGTSILEITSFDPKATTVSVPLLVALPVGGQLTARVQGIGANIDPDDFSLEEDEDKLFAVAVQPVTIN